MHCGRRSYGLWVVNLNGAQSQGGIGWYEGNKIMFGRNLDQGCFPRIYPPSINLGIKNGC